ncbi:MAG: hypothetical protein EXR94_04690 [Gemmatimonadetes bacterium]|nr:hypothetical protein [Gemmatimonadota bacterium]
MTPCELLSDRMAKVAAGDAGWTADEAGHLAACADCAAEWRLQSAAGHLGRRLPPLDPARIVTRLHQELATDRPEVVPLTRRGPVRWALGLAAAALILAVRMVGPSGGSGPADSAVPGGVLSELDDLSGQELASVLEVIEVDRPGPSVEEPGLGDLTADEWERLLRNWEG